VVGLAPRIALWTGVLLILIGLACRYLLGLRGFGSLTAALVGMPIALLGFVATEPQYTRGALRGVALVALLGVLIAWDALPRVVGLLRGEPQPDGTVALLAQGALLLLCGALLAVCGAALLAGWWGRARGPRRGAGAGAP
jgi:hypothetical protein